jgi:SNF2 family DNA or RNA helicase
MTPEQEAELAAMGLTVADFDGAPQRLHALQLAGGAGKDKSLLPAERVEAVRRRAEEIRTRVQPEVPTSITAQLRPYQLEGFHFLAYLSTNRFGGVLADDMGLGKTLQSLTWLAWLRETEHARDPASSLAPVLVVCPKSVQDNWRSETARFCPGLRVTIWSRDDAGKSGLDGGADLVVIHYQQLRQHEEALSRQRWLAVILDEAQAIKNPTSLSAKAACALQAGHRLALSGTPVENRLLDLWSILGFAMPGILGNRTHFAKHFDAKEDPLARRRLAARVRPFLLRRTKKEVAKDLPDRVEEDLVCELEGSQRTLYQAELKRARAALLNIKTSKQLDKARFNILTSLLRLRQICCHPALVLKEDAAAQKDVGGKAPKRRGKASSADAATSATGSAKLDALLELLEPIMDEGGKVLVFSQFVDMLHLVRSQIEAREYPHFLLTGQTEDRGALVQQFQKCVGPAVFLISLKAGGFGLNLTAASYVVLCDPWWNPAVEAQAIDRTHRIGQTQKVNAYRLIVKDSIEEKIRLLQKQKSALAQDILGEENFASALSLDDFRFLLGEE